MTRITLQANGSRGWAKDFMVLRDNSPVGLIVQPYRQAGFYQGWKAWQLGWDNKVLDGSCKTFFGRTAKRDATTHASQGKQ